MGRIVVMMKRWWVLALVFTLALSLTSCTKKKSNLFGSDYGFGYCDGTMGNFDVYVIPSASNSGLFEVSIIPVQVAQEGDIVKVNVLNQGLPYKELVSQVVLQTDQEIFAGFLTEQEINTYDTIAITPYDPNQALQTDFPYQNNEKDAICSLPMPGFATGDELGTPGQKN